MKKFNELTEKQQTKALNYFALLILKNIVEDGLRFDDELNHDDFQARIDAAIKKAEDKQTPWFAGELLLEDSVCKEIIYGMATCDAEDAHYLEEGESIKQCVYIEDLK
jgi:hypothetical protein